MEREQYELMYQQEDRHWWYAGMRRISASLLERYVKELGSSSNHQLEVLDAGCGSGGTTRFLQSYGRVTGIDLSSEAIRLAKRRGIKRLVRGSIAELPFAEASFDIVTSFDVLYHFGVHDDLVALRELCRVLRPGGLFLVRVPAYDWIRGAHDRAVHTRHRYTRGELRDKLRTAGFTVERASYANSILFPLAPAKRLLERRKGAPIGAGHGTGLVDLWLPPAPLNRLLTDLLGLESLIVTRSGLGWGLSVFAVARRQPRKRGASNPRPALEVAAAR